MAIYKRPVGYGSFTPNKIIADHENMPKALVDGKWMMARPEPYWSFWERLRQAWDVLTYKADALYWHEFYFPNKSRATLRHAVEKGSGK